MKLKTKISFIVIIAWATVAILFYFGPHRLMLNTYLEFEKQSITETLNRTDAALNQILNTMMVNVKDWSIWDETYQFMQDRNKDGRFIKSTLTKISLESLNSDMLILLDRNGKVAVSLAVNRERDQLIDIPTISIQLLSNNRKLINYSDMTHAAQGFISTPSGILMVASHSILNSEGKGPPQGTLIIAKYLTNPILNDIQELVGGRLALYRLPQAIHTTETAGTYQKLLGVNSDILTTKDDKISGYRFLKDINGDNIAIIQADLSRTIYQTGIVTITYSNFMLLMYGIILTFLLWLLLQHLIIRRIEKLTNHIAKLGNIENTSDELSSVVALYHEATHDPLTGLASRNLICQAFNELSKNHAAHHKKIVILYIDLDHFKHLNDSFGHHVGNNILKLTATRITATLRNNDMAARLGGDEFIVMKTDIESDQVETMSCEIFESINAPYAFTDRDLPISCSMGVCVYPDDGTTFDTLMQQADMALYYAKEHGRNHYQFYSSALRTSIDEDHFKELELQYAIEKNQLCLYFQPIYDLRTKKIVSLEALIRWNHPTKGLLGADEIIPLAEKTNLIQPLGDWVLKTAIAHMMAWQKMDFPLIPVAVNISASQLKQPKLSEKIIRLLADAHIPPNLLEIEITETGFINITPNLLNELYALKAVGIKLIIDDFGTGYAGLGYLKSLPVDKLKIDKSFVRDILFDPDDRAITLAIIAIAHQLNLRVTAEGIENIEQYHFLSQHQADEGQGHFMSAALSAADCEQLLSETKKSGA